MEKYQGVAMTDGINRKTHIFPLSAIIKAYHASWHTALPMNLGHDRTKPVGYTMLTGIYMEPGKAYVTNESAIMEAKEEYEIMQKMISAYDNKIFCVEHKNELDTLTKKLRGVLSDEFRVAPVGQAVAIKDKDLVYRLFPEWSQTIKDGLADVRDLQPVYTKSENGEKGFLIPGVYYKDGYLLFGHQFFRRSLSILNSTNEEFFNSFEKMRDIPGAEIKLALDMDMVGLAGTEHPELEYQYIWGPHFNDDLDCIPEGVTCHENEYYDNLFSNLLSTQFYWHIQDGKRTFECEELCDKENVSFDDGKTMLWGCRYVHSMINPSTGLPTHLDGAIRIYNDVQILDRIDSKTDISKYDILLLDVEMKNMNGIELAKRIRKDNNRAEIIFITSHFEFVGEGYEVDALHYLIKPISAEKLTQVLTKAAEKILVEPPSVVISCEGETVKLYESDILYVESFLHYIVIHTKDKEYKIKENISVFENKVSDDFYRIHRSYLVSLKYITRISRTSVNIGSTELPLSRGKYDDINRAFIEHN